MPDFRVEWAVDIVDETPEGAARLAESLIREPRSLSRVFDVKRDGEVTRVDLTEIDRQAGLGGYSPDTEFTIRDWRYNDPSEELTAEQMADWQVKPVLNENSLDLQVTAPDGSTRSVWIEIDKGVLRVRSYGPPHIEEPLGEMHITADACRYGTEFRSEETQE
jgi:hypothetical protein